LKRGERKNVAASVRERLYPFSVRQGEDFGLVLTRYALERLLFRWSRSDHRDSLVLKGALRFQVWTGAPHRPTRDLDRQGGRTLPRGPRAAPARHEQARIPPQIDIGFGDLVSPAPATIDDPTLLGAPPPRIGAYSMESAIAEKLEAMASLGLLNSRMKNFYDVWLPARTFPFQGVALRLAVEGTFAKRKTAWPKRSFGALPDELGADASELVQGRAFLRRSRLSATQESAGVVSGIREFAAVPEMPARWSPGGLWVAV
jgi:hypothetical protein